MNINKYITPEATIQQLNVRNVKSKTQSSIFSFGVFAEFILSNGMSFRKC